MVARRLAYAQGLGTFSVRLTGCLSLSSVVFKFLLHSFTVSEGTFTATVPARGAIAIHTGAQGKGAGSALVVFEETATTTWGEASSGSDH